MRPRVNIGLPEFEHEQILQDPSLMKSPVVKKLPPSSPARYLTSRKRFSKHKLNKISFVSLILLHMFSGCATRSRASSHISGLSPSRESKDFLEQRQEFRLEQFLTETRHPKTWNFSKHAGESTEAGIKELLQVDNDIVDLFSRGSPAFENTAKTLENALREGQRILVYGCGSTGRLAKTLEAMWNAAWERMDAAGVSDRVSARYPSLRHALEGEITGADRALISSLPGFEDIALIGAMQMMEDHHVEPNDILIGVSEGGETSSVLGALSARTRTQPNPNRTFFITSNPEEALRKVRRSREALENSKITTLTIPSGPQAIAGSTRMQSTTSTLFLLGSMLEDCLSHILAEVIDEPALHRLGVTQSTLAKRLVNFSQVLGKVRELSAALAVLTDAETQTYRQNAHAVYWAKSALTSTFTDVTERSPTFRLAPLDTSNISNADRHSWIRVLTPARDKHSAWQNLLGRNFQGLNTKKYEQRFKNEIRDSTLLEAALNGLRDAGAEQGDRYDLSASLLENPNQETQEHDLILAVAFPGEEEEAERFLRRSALGLRFLLRIGHVFAPSSDVTTITASVPDDLLGLSRHIALKLLLNSHSTTVMAKLDRVVGNTMAYVQPSNLKLIGRATYLIQTHVNDIRQAQGRDKLSYDEANLLLFEAIDKRKHLNLDSSPPEVILAVAYAILRQENTDTTWDDAARIISSVGINAFKGKYTSSSPHPPD